MTKHVPAGEFKEKCLAILADVQAGHGAVVVTKRGKPVAKLVPIPDATARQVIGAMKGTIEILGDIVSPTGDDWDADDSWLDRQTHS
jgi:prevent-host-death family protein